MVYLIQHYHMCVSQDRSSNLDRDIILPFLFSGEDRTWLLTHIDLLFPFVFLVPVRTVFGHPFLPRSRFTHVVLSVLGQSRLQDFCGSSRLLRKRFNISFFFFIHALVLVFHSCSCSWFLVRAIFGHSLVLRSSFDHVLLNVLAQSQLLDFCGSSEPVCQSFLVSGGDAVTTEHPRTWPPALAPVPIFL